MIECLCIDSKGKPKEVPLGRWIQKGFHYHITHVYYHPLQGVQGCLLNEVKMDSGCFPYVAYKLSRFAVTEQGLQELIQMMMDYSELDKVDIEKLLKESEINVTL